ncbi:MAG: glycosyltransferase family 9 protein [Sedimentisphaerales bacterium]
MQENDNILNLLKEKGAEAARRALRGVILQPGAIGDCVLALPLAEFMKDCLGLGGVDILGHTEYIGILPGRTCVDGIRSIDSVDLHRLFVETDTFDLVDGDALINVFGDYAWIVTFLGEPDSNFEQNLIFTANCSRSTEVITLSIKPSEKLSAHITDFYIQQFIAQSGLSLEPRPVQKAKSLIKATRADINRGRELLEETEGSGVVSEINVDFYEKLVVIQPGSGGSHKCCHLDNFLVVAEELVSKNVQVIFLLGPAEMERWSASAMAEIGAVAGQLVNLSLADVLAVLSNAAGFIGNDSGITHLAAAMGVKTVAVFGPTDPAVYGPIGPDVTVVASSDADFTRKPSASLQQELLNFF